MAARSLLLPKAGNHEGGETQIQQAAAPKNEIANRRRIMTIGELKAFIEGMGVKDAPTKEQWTRIAEKIESLKANSVYDCKSPTKFGVPIDLSNVKIARGTNSDPNNLIPVSTCSHSSFPA